MLCFTLKAEQVLVLGHIWVPRIGLGWLELTEHPWTRRVGAGAGAGCPCRGRTQRLCLLCAVWEPAPAWHQVAAINRTIVSTLCFGENKGRAGQKHERHPGCFCSSSCCHGRSPGCAPMASSFPCGCSAGPDSTEFGSESSFPSFLSPFSSQRRSVLCQEHH